MKRAAFTVLGIFLIALAAVGHGTGPDGNLDWFLLAVCIGLAYGGFCALRKAWRLRPPRTPQAAEAGTTRPWER